ncbi:MAG: Xaa-Pro peptidase family protein [Syntrophales bacterium]|nr:Xaa-Pro peptidase family protein [Syntrophales bacterium]
MDYSQRKARVVQRLSAFGVDALLFFDMANIRYLTGFTGSDGVLYVAPDTVVLLVDGRYTTQAREQAVGVEVVEYREKMPGLAAKAMELPGKVLGFESYGLSYDLYEQLAKQLPEKALRPIGEELRGLRNIKEEAEVACLEAAAEMAHRALGEVLPLIKPGVEEREIAVELEYRIKRQGAEDISFPTIVASGPNGALPHARPGTRKIKEGDAVIIDYGAVVEGYRADETCTYLMEGAPSELQQIYAIVHEAQRRGIAALRPGISCREVDGIVRGYIEERGYGSYFSHGTGHGVGLCVHEPPRLAATSEGVLEAGMVVTVEPGIYLPGKWGVRLEDMVLIAEEGVKVLTKTPKG